MSSGYQLKDLTDLVDAVARELKIQSSDEVERERIKEDINDLYQDIAARKRWMWLQGHVDVQHKPYYGSGTVSVTPDSTTITFSVAPSVSLGSFAGRYFSVDNFSEIYTIDAHTAGATSATLKSAYTGTLNGTAAFKVWTDQVVLPTDCRETVEVWHDFSSTPLEPLGHQELRKRQSENPKAQARPFYYNTYDFVDPTPLTDETESDRYRVLKVFPAIYSDSTTMHIDYVKEVPHLVDDGDEPLMPIEDRIVLSHGAKMLAWMRQRNPEASEMNRQRYEEKLARMMGKVEEAVDKPQLTPDSLYISRKRGPRLKSLRGSTGSSGSGGSYTAPSYLAGATINGATITGNVTVSSSITIDGRDISADGAALDGHIAGTSGKHTAADITNVPSGNLAGVTVQAALNELQTDVDTRALDSDLDSHIADSGAHAASNISSTPSGNLSASDVQTALDELQTDVDTRATTTALSNHEADTTSIHGIADTADLLTTSNSKTVTNKTIDAASNTITNVSLTTGVTGTLPIANGGTGQASAANAINALLPSQGSNGGKFLTTDGSVASWAAATPVLAVASKTGAYTATTADDLILCDSSGGAFTLTLYTAVGNTGRQLRIKKTDSSFNAITIDGNSSETIDGALTRKICTQFETFTLVSDGSNWSILDHASLTPVATYTPTLTGFGTPSSVTSTWYRDGQYIVINGRATSGTPTATQARWSLPSGLTTMSSTYIPATVPCGTGAFAQNEATQLIPLMSAGVTYIPFGRQSSLANGLNETNATQMAVAGDQFAFTARLLIADWEA